jgi:hypothetical protein
MRDHSAQDQPQGGFLTSRSWLVMLGFLVIIGALLFTEHRAHVLMASAVSVLAVTASCHVRVRILWQQGHRLLPDARMRLSSHRVSLVLIIALLPHILPLLRPHCGDRDG